MLQEFFVATPSLDQQIRQPWEFLETAFLIDRSCHVLELASVELPVNGADGSNAERIAEDFPDEIGSAVPQVR